LTLNGRIRFALEQGVEGTCRCSEITIRACCTKNFDLLDTSITIEPV